MIQLELSVDKRAQNWWKQRSACALLSHSFARFIMGLSIKYKIGGKEQYRLFSGFLYSQREFPVWITAGHICKDVEALKSKPDCEILAARWLDGGIGDGMDSFPFDISEVDPVYINDGGLDLGIIPITRYWKKLLDANKSKYFLDETSWLVREIHAPEVFFLLGLPEERRQMTSERISPHHVGITVSVPLCCLPVREIKERLDVGVREFWESPCAFFGKIEVFEDSDEDNDLDIKYMSGGPILAIEESKPGVFDVRLAAIQVSWLKSERIIRGVRFEIVAHLLEKLFDDILARRASEGI